MLLTVEDQLLSELETKLLQDIPLTRYMGLKVVECNGKGLLISAPLAPNSNHLATAFGGSLAAATTLACWGMLWLTLKQRERHARIVIQESSISYVRPVTSDFIARCYYPDETAVDRMLATFDRQGKARIELESDVFEYNHPCVGFRGKFVILPDC